MDPEGRSTHQARHHGVAAEYDRIGLVQGAAMVLGETPGAVTALIAVAAAAFYGAASLGARVAYEPLGIKPREIGLTGGTVLAQSAIGVLAVIVLAVLLYAVVTRAASALWVRRPRARPPRAPGIVLLAVYFIALALTCIVLMVASVAARQDLERGVRPGSVVGLPALWPADVATLHWARNGPNGNIQNPPQCALYIGQSNAISILYDARHQRTLRVQSSGVAVETTQTRDRC